MSILLRYQNSGDELVASTVIGIVIFMGIAIYRIAKTKIKK